MSFWKSLRNRLFAPPATPGDAPPPPRIAPPAAPQRALNPAYLAPTSVAAGSLGGARFFDPALKHYGHAFRPGDPVFNNEDAARRWVGLRRLASDHVLRAIAE